MDKKRKTQTSTEVKQRYRQNVLKRGGGRIELLFTDGDQLHEKLLDYCEKTGTPKATAIKKMMAEFLDNQLSDTDQ